MKGLKKMMAGAALVLLSACASAGTGTAAGSGGRDLILSDEIARSGAADAYSLVQSVRPQWLRVRGDQGRGSTVRVGTTDPATGEAGVGQGSMAPSPNVYLNNARMGAADALRQIPLANVRYVRWFTPAQANLRWGAGNGHGAILVSTEELIQ
ncbi:hypothetical protein [Longimicrobium sp.]|uniref:hypothetical protein n=1 Tax=Longimicrobium sp. TaxID=2029185 RepID=UPI002E381F9E|nr:hypothetical protein [Longimicrobium sp.]HEX6040246.1 hypothetical protein [Longimicrobium sp.]